MRTKVKFRMTINARDGTKEKKPAEGIRVAPGLVVHEESEGKRFTVSHRGSGLSLVSEAFYLAKIKTALRVGKKVAKLADWTKHSKILAKKKDLGEKVRAIFINAERVVP